MRQHDIKTQVANTAEHKVLRGELYEVVAPTVDARSTSRVTKMGYGVSRSKEDSASHKDEKETGRSGEIQLSLALDRKGHCSHGPTIHVQVFTHCPVIHHGKFPKTFATKTARC